MRYGREVRSRLSFPAAVERTRQALAEQGFGVLTEIDVAATLRAKIGADVDPQLILGACNPQLAHQALQAEPGIGLLLPCNVVVRRDGDTTLVAALDPQLLSSLTGRPELKPIADEAARRLQTALDEVAAADDAPATVQSGR